MIAMLRRRLMGSMTKAKNIATGTVSAGNTHYKTTSISAQTGFRPDHVAVFIASERTESALQFHVLSVYDGGVLCFNMDTWYMNASSAQFTLSDSGFTVANVFDDGNNQCYFTGTYRYVAWQE